jgi:hypothetical protein
MAARRKTNAGREPSDSSADYKPGSLGIFEFTPEDLRANQRGQLTDGQRGWLQSTARGITSCSMSSAVIALVFVFIGLTLILGLYLSNEDSRRALFSSPMNLVGLAASGVIGVGAVGLSVVLARRRAGTVARSELRVVHGPVRLEQDYSARYNITSYHVIVGKEKFSFTDDMSSVFREGRPYTIYFTGSGPYKMIMSYEQAGS